MLVNRITLPVKPGRVGKMVEMIKEAETMVETPHGSLIYTPYVGQQNVVIHDIKFENLTEVEEYWTVFWSHPDASAFRDRFNELLESNCRDEILNLVE